MYRLLMAAGVGVAGTIISSYLIEENIMKNADINIEKPVDTVSIIMSSYNEEMLIKQAVSSIREQSIIQQYPEMFEFILVDSGSTDNTVNMAKSYVDRVIITKRGKLTARNIATDNAKGNIIVSVDSDSYYPRFTLNTLLKAFKSTSTVGVAGNTLDYSIPNIPGQLHTLMYQFERFVSYPKQMPGRLSAYKKELFYKVGKFNETINQLSLSEMLDEEERSFGDKLSKFGDVVFVPNATCIHLGGVKIACRNNLEAEEKCELLKIGVDRF